MTNKNSLTPILDTIKTPSDLKLLSLEDLQKLCKQLRADLIQRVNQAGGHFASSLGVTEITVALHKVLETPYDKIIWDVGHQAYIHKILTGRREDMLKVRQLNGISGFPRPSESEYDAFVAGHAGNSISAACGIIEASYHNYPEQTSHKVVAVIGDGAMTSGMAFEALNHSGQLHRNLIVLLNDNEMSIAPNVGALSWAFSKTLTGKISTSARKHFKSLVSKGLIPKTFYRALDKAEEATQGFFSTPAMLFGAFGYRYIGPVDGHNLSQLIQALEHAKEQDGPVLIHALTLKGKGFEPAEEDPISYHAVSPFTLIKGGTNSIKIEAKNTTQIIPQTYTEVFGKTALELCKLDKRVVAITAAMPDGTGLDLLAKEMPDRFFDVGIAEQHAVTFAAGLASQGMRPICAIYSSFLQRAYDQIMHDVCLESLPVIFAIDRAGLVGQDGGTHQGVFDIAFLRMFPNMVIMAPKDEAELIDMLYFALDYDKGPVAIRYPRGHALGVNIPNSPRTLSLAEAEVLREAKNKQASVLLCGLGQTVAACEIAAQKLAKQGIECSVDP